MNLQQSNTPDLQSYLHQTPFCDFTNPLIEELAKRFSQGSQTQQAIQVFRWVQDEIRYSVRHDWSQKASETLSLRAGSCTNKANLFVAILRALGIPSGFHIMKVVGKRYFGPVWIPMLQQLCDDVSIHVHAAVHLSGRWLKVDPSDDKVLCDNTSHINPPSEYITFDGYKDAVLNFHPTHVLEVSSCLPSVDMILQKKTSKPKVFFEVMDTYLQFGRMHGRIFQSPRVIEPVFRKWLSVYYPAMYKEFRELEKNLAAA